MVTKKEILAKLSEVIDPEIGINIVDMGLIYGVEIKGNKAYVKMTFTTPACPLIILGFQRGSKTILSSISAPLISFNFSFA